MKCKVINTSKFNIEEEVNNWLQNNNFEIVNILQSQDTSYITLTIFYLEKNEVRKEKIDKLNKLKKN